MAPRSAPRTRQHGASRQTSDPTSDHATTTFILRTLCSHQIHNSGHSSNERDSLSNLPIGDLLPPLTSSNEIDLQLYAFIAIIIKELVQPWYSKITPDHVFVDEVIQIIAHCTRALEQRIRKVDLESLLLDEIPAILATHINVYRIARDVQNANTDPHHIYHTLWPHPALSPLLDPQNPLAELEQQQNDQAYRQLVAQGILAVLLPTEDLQNPCLRTLVSEVLSEFILGNIVAGRMSDSIFIWEAISKVSETLQPYLGYRTWPFEDDVQRKEELGVREPPATKARGTTRPRGRIRIKSLFWLVLQFMYIGISAMRTMVMALVTASALPPRVRKESTLGASWTGAEAKSQLQQHSREKSHIPPKPIVTLRAWTMVDDILSLSLRMPWLSGLVAMVQHQAVYGPLRLAGADGRVDR